jgi:hypothetical protein
MEHLELRNNQQTLVLTCLLVCNFIERVSFLLPPLPLKKRFLTSITTFPQRLRVCNMLRVLPEAQKSYGWKNLNNQLHKNSKLTEKMRIDAL